jgi:hypothetical protein
MEVNFGFDDIEPLNIDFNDGPTISQNEPSISNLGVGIELLMNDKQRQSTSGNIEIGDLDKLESELNELTSGGDSQPFINNNFDGETIQMPRFIEPSSNNDSKLGTATVETIGYNSNESTK